MICGIEVTFVEAHPYIIHSDFTDKKAPSSKCLLSVQVPFHETADRTAFLLRANLYHWFGFDESRIPYTVTNPDGIRVVAKQALFETPGQDG